MPVSAAFLSDAKRGADRASRPCPQPAWNLHLENPVRVIETWRVEDVLPGLKRVGEACAQGLWAAVALAYEAAPAFDPALRVRPPDPDGFPLLWAALFQGPSEPAAPSGGEYEHTPWTPLVDQAEHGRAVDRVRQRIALGETYQANYTLPFECAFQGDARAWFQDLLAAQQAGYAAYLDTGRHRVLSLSPELFFRRHGNMVTARPMKGTSVRGGTPAEDAALRDRLAACPKNRAENVMITDLTRSDLGRLAKPGTVNVHALCAVEPYPTVWQMVSEVRAELKPGTGTADLFTALFPCGSVTGAPKIRTVDILRELEPHPRGLYCGAIGFVAPGGDCVFNVPIRTVVLDADSGRARFHVGGGITWDSTAEDEFQECLAKMRFLAPDAAASGEPFELLETLLLDRRGYAYLSEHLERMAKAADRFGYPWSEGAARTALDRAGREADVSQGRFRVRLLLDARGGARAECFPLPPPGRSVRDVGWAAAPVDSSDPFLAHKTTQRAVYDRALASRPDCDDALLFNERGEATESCLANLVVRLDGKLWTPDARSGLLNGVFRQRLIERGVVRERVLSRTDVERAERVWLVNSVRRWMDVRIVRDQAARR